MEFITDVLLILCIMLLAYCAVATTMWHIWEKKCEALEVTKKLLRKEVREQHEQLNQYRLKEIVSAANAYARQNEEVDNG